MMNPRVDSFSKPWMRVCGLLICALLLSSCGGGSGNDAPIPPVLPPVPPPVNASGPGEFKAATLLKTVSSAEIAAAIRQDGAAAFVASPRYAVTAYRLDYLTIDGAGREILASALMALPQKPAGASSPVVGYQHATITREIEAPSHMTMLASPEVVMASLGYIVLSADYVGYGISRGASHPYMLSGPSAAVVIDMLTAAKFWRQTQQVPDNKQLFLGGYSEGGYVTMATHRALQAGISSHRNELVRAVPAAGPFDVALTLDEALKLVRQQYPVIGQLLRPGLLKYLSDADRNNVRDALLQAVMGADSDVVFMSTALDDYLADDRSSIELRSDVDDWLPELPVFLFHGPSDTTVSYLNSTRTLQAMQARGAANLVSLADCKAEPAGHLECVQPFWQFMLTTFGKAAKDL